MKKTLLLILIISSVTCGYTQQYMNNSPSTNLYSINGNIGIGTQSPRGKLDVDGGGSIYLSDDVDVGTTQSIYLPGHIYIAPYNGTNISYIQARRSDDSGTTALQLRTFNDGVVSEAVRIEGNGNVGIGTTAPSEPLHVSGRGNNGELNFLIQNTGSNGARTFLSAFPGKSSIQTDKDFTISTNGGGWSDKFILTNSGNVGIGTLNPGNYRLAVEGKIGAREVNVTASSWPDYVFENTYKLPSLLEIESYIKQNKHLPEVPSEAEVKENGINVGEMNALLLKKIEELTLYVIELKKENAEIEQLKKRIEVLENR